MKQRAKKVLVISLGLLICGLAYGIFFVVTGIGIPCMFYKVTGFRCPGCGVTHMCAALMQGDIPGAIQSNPMIFFLSPLLLFILGDNVFWYIKKGTVKTSKWQDVVVSIMIVLLIGYGIFRNL